MIVTTSLVMPDGDEDAGADDNGGLQSLWEQLDAKEKNQVADRRDTGERVGRIAGGGA